jgi:hypothetical protein
VRQEIWEKIDILLFRMKLGMYYDQNFKARFGADSIAALRRVVAQVT